MKITQSQLRQIIKEELETILGEELYSDERPPGRDPDFKVIPEEAWINAARDSGFNMDVANKHYLRKNGYGYSPTFRWRGTDWAGAHYKRYDPLSDSGGTFFGRNLLGKAIEHAKRMEK